VSFPSRAVAAAVIVVAACSSNPQGSMPQRGDASASATTYACSVVQVRNGDCSCAEAQPPGSLSGPDASRTFAMVISATTISVPGSFSCDGSEDGGTLDCVIGGCPYEGCGPPCNESCKGTVWEVSPQDPQSRPLDAGEIYAGIPANNSFAAHCHPQ
jgi:hypothetical protein